MLRNSHFDRWLDRQAAIPMLIGFFLFASAACFAQEPRYRILVSNDDGIDAAGLAAVAGELAKTYDVVVSAPMENYSGASQSTSSRTGPTPVRKVEKEGKLFGYAVGGTPADAVRFGIFELGKERKFDLVVSGINHGANVGNVAHHSGTVGAAMEGLYYGIPAIAVSLNGSRGFEAAAKFTAQLVEQVRKHGAPKNVVLSVNVPIGEIKGVAIAPMGGSYLQFQGFQQASTEGDVTNYRGRSGISRDADEKSDTHAMQAGFITVTPLKFDWTDYPLMDELKKWDLTPQSK